MMKYRSKTFTEAFSIHLALCLTFFFLAFLLSMGQIRSSQEALADRLAPQVLRFHILANSDSDADQQVKLEVRSLILDYMQNHLQKNAGKEEIIQWMDTHRASIEQLADRYLKDRGFNYRTQLQLTHCYFPTRTYDRFIFPCGMYDAARITLGTGAGHNWWCVIYPRFCFLDAACSSVPEESSELLQQKLKQDDYLALEDHRPVFEIRLKSLSLFHPGIDRSTDAPQS